VLGVVLADERALLHFRLGGGHELSHLLDDDGCPFRLAAAQLGRGGPQHVRALLRRCLSPLLEGGRGALEPLLDVAGSVLLVGPHDEPRRRIDR
jgi:hypothetical protein